MIVTDELEAKTAESRVSDASMFENKSPRDFSKFLGRIFKWPRSKDRAGPRRDGGRERNTSARMIFAGIYSGGDR